MALYTFKEPTVNLGSAQFKVKVIETPLNNIKSEKINKPISSTSYSGINGGFFDGDYNSPPDRPDSISWSYNDQGTGKNYDYNGSPSNQVSRKTFVVYQEGNFYFGATMYARNISQVKSKYPQVREVIGGIGLNKSDWGSDTAYYGPTARTFMAYDGGGSKRFGYLIICPTRINVPAISSILLQLGLDPDDAVVLDGSGSTSMSIPGYKYNGENRYISNMVRLRHLER
ncbi:phosphodiester glycosidase family protein [Rossellomorea marisflavi]|uniref:phosphodiester glycosidase family protein n=1 Tax=Rossellomorea marisflavi TaxID=189381 RepID=UPI00064F6125|nr:phosphodiester glycosidase family protein [Rossellomorea marisflavi]KML00559.1 hypothetical protein VL06_20785 [Rossellomorea marisflavi]KML32360.1 hypothetical protein VL12_15265 [Rossellomorea marisflavi]VXC05975.1 conserved hypothetical protein [Bacillus sp. 349Y]